MARRASHKLPIARSEGLLTEEIGSEIVVYETETMEAHCLSPLAAAVFAGCDGRTTTEELAKRAGTRVGEPVGVADVEAALTQLDERKLLASPAGRMTRRRLMRRTAGATAALTAAPMITSVITSAYAQSANTDFVCREGKCVDGSAGDEWCSENYFPPDSCECLGCHDLEQEDIIEDEDACLAQAVICTDEEIAADQFGCVERGEPGGEIAKDLREGMCIDLGGDSGG